MCAPLQDIGLPEIDSVDGCSTDFKQGSKLVGWNMTVLTIFIIVPHGTTWLYPIKFSYQLKSAVAKSFIHFGTLDYQADKVLVMFIPKFWYKNCAAVDISAGFIEPFALNKVPKYISGLSSNGQLIERNFKNGTMKI